METKDKRSFVLFYEIAEDVLLLEREEIADLFLAILSTGGVCEMPELNRTTEAVFRPIRRSIEENARKWERTRKARSENGKKGGRPRKATVDEKAKKAKKAVTVTDTATATVTVTDTDTVNVTATDTDTDTVNDTVNESVNKHTIVQRTLADAETHPADAEACAADAGECSADAERLCVSSSSGKDKSSPSMREVEAHFEALWQLFPRKEGKAAVKPETRRALMTVSAEEMERCVERYRAQVAADRASGFERKWMLGSTWFNGERWKDYCDEGFCAPEPLPDAKPAPKSARGYAVQMRSPEEEARNAAYYASIEE